MSLLFCGPMSLFVQNPPYGIITCFNGNYTCVEDRTRDVTAKREVILRRSYALGTSLEAMQMVSGQRSRQVGEERNVCMWDCWGPRALRHRGCIGRTVQYLSFFSSSIFFARVSSFPSFCF